MTTPDALSEAKRVALRNDLDSTWEEVVDECPEAQRLSPYKSRVAKGRFEVWITRQRLKDLCLN